MADHKQTKIKRLPDAFSLFEPSWKAIRLNINAFALQFLIPFLLVLLTFLLFKLSQHSVSLPLSMLAIVSGVVASAVGLYVTASLVVTELRSVQGIRLSFEQALASTRHYFWRLIGLFLLSGLIIVIGFILFIVPGLFAIQRLLLAPYILVDKDISVIAAVRQSNQVAKKYSGPVWGVVGILLAVNLLGLIPIFGRVAAMVLSVWYVCAPAVRYTQIRS